MGLIIRFVLVVGIEIVSYLKIKPNDMESFFVFWAIAGVFLFLGKFLNMEGINVSSTTVMGNSETQARKFKNIRMFSSASTIYIIVAILNAVGFAIIHFK